VLWRVRYKLSLRDLPEMFLERGLVFTHEAVWEREAQLAPLLSETLRNHRRGRIGHSWYTDKTYIKVKGRWTYLYRAIDRDGNLVNVLLSEKRIAQRRKPSCDQRARSLIVFRSALPLMAILPILEPSKQSWGTQYSIAPTVTSIIIWSRTIEESSEGRAQWGDSRVSSRRNAFATCMTKCGTSCARAHTEMRWYRSRNDGCSIRAVHVLAYQQQPCENLR